jgi:hypothetical protein
VALREEASESRRRDKAASHAKQDIDILYADAGTILGKTINSRVEGVRHHDIGNAQAWYYPKAKVLVLWECFLHDVTHDAPLLKDTNMSQLWAGFEKWLLDRYPETEKIITPYADPIWDIKESLVSEGTRV